MEIILLKHYLGIMRKNSHLQVRSLFCTCSYLPILIYVVSYMILQMIVYSTEAVAPLSVEDIF